MAFLFTGRQSLCYPRVTNLTATPRNTIQTTVLSEISVPSSAYYAECARLELMLSRLSVLKPERRRGFQLSELEFVCVFLTPLICSSPARMLTKLCVCPPNLSSNPVQPFSALSSWLENCWGGVAVDNTPSNMSYLYYVEEPMVFGSAGLVRKVSRSARPNRVYEIVLDPLDDAGGKKLQGQLVQMSRLVDSGTCPHRQSWSAPAYRSLGKYKKNTSGVTIEVLPHVLHAYLCDVAKVKANADFFHHREPLVTENPLTALCEGDIVYCESVVVRKMIQTSGRWSSTQPWAEFEARLQLHRLLILYRA